MEKKMCSFCNQEKKCSTYVDWNIQKRLNDAGSHLREMLEDGYSLTGHGTSNDRISNEWDVMGDHGILPSIGGKHDEDTEISGLRYGERCDG